MIALATILDKSSLPSKVSHSSATPLPDHSQAFASLLHSLATARNTQKNDPATLGTKDTGVASVQKDAKTTSNSKSALLSLLKTDGQNSSSKNTKLSELNPNVTANLDAKQLPIVIKDAKNYLKEQILNSPAYKKSEIIDLPKTLGGLVTLAKKVGIPVDTITLETIQPNNKSLNGQLPTTATDLVKIPLLASSEEPSLTHSTVELVTSKQAKSDPKTTTKADDALKNLLRGDKTTNQQPTQSTNTQTVDPKLQSQLASQVQTKSATLIEAKAETKSELKLETKIEAKTQTPSATLSQLLHDKNAKTTSNEDTSTQNQNPVTAPLISPASTTNSLHVNQSSDDLSVKIHEAKQMVKYLAQNIKQAIDDYKPPFTKINVTLNPAKLGEVDLTVIQRGSNVHVNISSNSAAINLLSQNVTELKNQLVQNGMNNASFNFNGSTDNQSQQQQQNGHQQQSAKKAYGQFGAGETNEEVLSSLEIVIPRYI